MRRTRPYRPLLCRGFTLVEMIGVMAIAAIVLALVAPSVVRQFQTAAAIGEDAKLDDIAQALTNAIRATGLIPNPNLDPATTNATAGYGWAYLASNYTRLSGATLLSVFPGSTTDTRRRLYLSTNLAGLASNGGFNRTISNWGATVFPTNAKMYLVSASRPDFVLVLAANGSNAQTTANNYASVALTSLEGWNKQFSNGICAAPTNLADASWATNKGEFLHVRAIDLAPIFNEVRAAQQKAIEQEDKNLEEIARALVAAIQATAQIPNPNVAATNTGGWAAMAQSFTSLSSDDLQNVFGTNSTTQRRFYLSGNLANYIQNQNSGSNSTLAAGWSTNSFATNLFFVLVSSSKEDLLLTCPTGVNLGATDVDWLKNWVKKPDSLGSFLANNLNVLNWTNRGEFLHVKTVDLKGSFKKVSLIDYASPPVSAIVNSPGSGYVSESIDSLQVGATYRFFTFGATNTNRTLPNNTTGQPVGFNKSIILRSVIHTNYSLDDPAVAGETTAKFTLTLPGVPLWEISNLGTQPMSTSSNENTFYVLSGSVLSLYGEATNKIMSFPINADATFEYFNGTWSQKN